MLHYDVYIFINAYYSQGQPQVEETHQKFFLFVFIDNTEKKVAMRFEGEKVQDIIYEITLFSYLDQDNELPIDQSISFLRVAHSV